MGDQLRAPPEISRTSQDYRVERFKVSLPLISRAANTSFWSTPVHPNSHNLGADEDDDDGAIQMLIPLSVLVQLDSVRAQMKGNGGGFQII